MSRIIATVVKESLFVGIIIAATMLVSGTSGLATTAPQHQDGAKVQPRVSAPHPPAAAHPIEFSYEDPSKWPGICNTGKLQSPIDFNVDRLVLERNHALSPLHFSRECRMVDNVTGLMVTNNGHTIMATLVGIGKRSSGEPIHCRVSDPVSGDEFAFAQMHLHEEGEHKFQGSGHSMELHLVFQQAVSGRTLVVGIPLQVIKDDNNKNAGSRFVNLMVSGAPNQIGRSHMVSDAVSSNEGGDKSLSMSNLITRSDGSYFTYVGSLTTPPCTENVRWVVLANPGYVSSASLTHFKKIMSQVSASFSKKGNARPTQPGNRRTVQLFRDPSGDHQGEYLRAHTAKGTFDGAASPSRKNSRVGGSAIKEGDGEYETRSGRVAVYALTGATFFGLLVYLWRSHRKDNTDSAARFA